MQELTKTVDQISNEYRHIDSPLVAGDPPSEMLEAAYKWARTSLDCFTGTLLLKAMRVSAALADFAHEAKSPSAE